MSIRRRYFFRRHRQRIMQQASVPAHHISCPVCAAKVRLPKMFQGQSANCPRCNAQLLRIERDPYILPIVYNLTALLILLVVSLGFFMGMSLPGAFANLNLADIVEKLVHYDFVFLAYVFFILVFATPLAFLFLNLYVYSALINQQKRILLRPAVKMIFNLKMWLMVDIFAVSALVALVKIRAVAQVEFGMAFFALFAYSLLLARIVVATPKQWIYSQLAQIYGQQDVFAEAKKTDQHCAHCHFRQPVKKERCAVCYSKMRTRKEASLMRSWAFLLAAIILYIPANVMPIMISANPFNTVSSQIVDGVFYLWNSGDKLIAVIIFIASVAVPLLKIVSMLILLLSCAFRPFFFAKKLTHLYHAIELIGRWSMVDVFVIMILMSVFSTHVARVSPGVAVIYFTWVVILTMFATLSFDIRLIWDKTMNTDKPS